MKLNNFYQDYVFNTDDFDEVYNMLKATAAKFNEYLAQLYDLRISGELEDFRIMPAQYINITPALYDPGVIFDSEELRKWNSPDISLTDKINMLRSKEKYIILTADRGFSGDAANEHKIVDFKLYDPNGLRMVHNIDYVYKNNSIYILNYHDWDTNDGVFFKMTDIAIDFNTVDDMLGKNLELSYDQEKISKSEFNKIVRKLTVSAIKGSLVSAVKDSVAELAGGESESIRVVDKMTTDHELASQWKDIFSNQDAETGLEIKSSGLSPFDFLIYYPLYFGDYKVRLLKEYLDKVRHAYTNYTELAYEPVYLEEYNKEISFEWMDTDLKPYLENNTLPFSDDFDEILYIIACELYYYERLAGETIYLERVEPGVGPYQILDSEGMWIRNEEFSKELLDGSEDEFLSGEEKAFGDKYEATVTDEKATDDLYIHYALLNDGLSRVGYNMILY